MKPTTASSTNIPHSCLIDEIDSIVEQLQNLGGELLAALSPPPGPKAIFYHQGMLIERLRHLQLLLRRLGQARARSTVLAIREANYRGEHEVRPGPYPKYLQRIASEQHSLVGSMQMDAESLYIFTNMALDQLSYLVAYTHNLSDPSKYEYAHLVNKLQGAKTPERLADFRAKLFEDALGVYFQVRFYRNVFIEHVSRPWQRGSSMSVYGEDFNFFICVPPGWLTPAEETKLLNEIKPLAPPWVSQLSTEDWQSQPRAVLEATYREIHRLPTQADRDKVWKIWSQIGGSTDSYHVIARRAIRFIHDAVTTLSDAVGEDPTVVNLGAP